MKGRTEALLYFCWTFVLVFFPFLTILYILFIFIFFSFPLLIFFLKFFSYIFIKDDGHRLDISDQEFCCELSLTASWAPALFSLFHIFIYFSPLIIFFFHFQFFSFSAFFFAVFSFFSFSLFPSFILLFFSFFLSFYLEHRLIKLCAHHHQC